MNSPFLSQQNEDKMSSSFSSSDQFGSIPKKRIPFLIRVLYLFFLIIHFFSWSETGIIISSSTDIINDLKLTDIQFALLGGVPAIGRAFASIILIYLTRMFENKLILLIGIFLKGFIFVLYKYIKNFYFVLITRFAIGFLQMFEVAYFPGWCDDNIPKNNTPLALLQIAKPSGFVFGFYYSLFNKMNRRWDIIFLMVGIMYLIIGVILDLFPKNIFYSYKMIYNKKKKKVHKEEREFEFITDTHEEEDYSQYMNNSTLNNKQSSLIQFAYMIRQPQFICSLLSHALFLYFFSSIQFYLKEYMTNSLGIFDHYNIFYAFITITLISPILGTIGNNCINGLLFENNKSKQFMITLLFFGISCIAGSIILFADQMELFIISLWFAISLGSFALPMLVNISLISTYYKFKLETFVLCNIVNNIIGNFLGIFIYGYVYSTAKKTNKKIGLIVSTVVIWFSFAFIIMTVYCNWRIPEKKQQSKKIIREKKEDNNKLRVSRTSDISGDIGKVNDNINPTVRKTIYDDDNFEENKSNPNYDEDHEYSISDILSQKPGL